MNYPLKETEYPGIWVQFSFQELSRASLEPVHKTEAGQFYMLGKFSGTVTLTTLSLSSLERDRISDALVQILLFGRENPRAEIFYSHLRYNDYVNLTIDNHSVRPSGQTTTLGTPWGTEDIVYEDTYNFGVTGQFASRYEDFGLVNLREIRIIPTNVTDKGYKDDYDDTVDRDEQGWV